MVVIRKLLLFDSVKHEIIMPTKLNAGEPIKIIVSKTNNFSNSIWRAIIMKGIISNRGIATVIQWTIVLKKRIISSGKSDSK